MNRRVLYGRLGGQARLNAFIRSLAPAAWFRQGVGITVTGSGVSQWDDQSGNGRHLLQGTDAARPIDLPFSGTRYLYLPGVAGNSATTPDAATFPTTGIDIACRLAAADWTPASQMMWMGKDDTGTQRACWASVDTGGTISFFRSPDGTVASGITAQSTASVSFTDGSAGWVRITFDSASGDVKFYTSADSVSVPSSWVQLGNTVSTAATGIFNSTTILSIGGRNGGSSANFNGKIYRAIIKNGIDGTTVVDFNPADADGDGDTSFASSTTGETWTINSSGGLPAQIVGRAAILFNGTSHYLKTAAFTLNQPTCVLWVGKQVSWTNFEYIFDGNASASGALIQNASSPNIRLTADGAVSFTDQNSGLSVGAVGVVASVFNGASSLTRVNRGSPATGNPGAGNMGGFTLASRGSPGALCHIQVYETVIFPIAPSTAQLDRLIAGLMARHGVA